MTQVKVAGQSYDIPDIWLAGFCTNNGCTVHQAILWWHWQSEMDRTGEWIEPDGLPSVFA